MHERIAPGRLPAYRDGRVTVFLGDAREVLADFPDACVDCVVTSPPYWSLRDFGVPATVWGGDPLCRHRWQGPLRGRRSDLLPEGSGTRKARIGLNAAQGAAPASGGRLCARCGAWLGSLGLEPSPDLYVAHMVELFREVRRVLKPTGTLWLNLGDCYFGSSRNRQATGGLKAKDLAGIPWRVAMALQADGWYLRSSIVWAKPNAVPEPARDRPVHAHELVLLLSREALYFYDAEAVREPAVSGQAEAIRLEPAMAGGKYARPHDPRVRSATPFLRRRTPISPDRHLRDVWFIPTQPFRGSHTATFPTKLVEPCILAGTSAHGCCSRCGRPWRRDLRLTYQTAGRPQASHRKDPRVFEMAVRRVRHAVTTGWLPTCDCGTDVEPAVVLDLFAGTGTTLAVARSMGRHAVGIELNGDYISLIKERLMLRQTQQRAKEQEEAA